MIMLSRRNLSARKMHGSILRDVSRSFYLSIRLLPRKLREPIGLAYLLARATDTVADTIEVPALTRAETLSQLRAIIQGTAEADQILEVTQRFAPLQTNEAERKLINALPDCFHHLSELNAADREDIRLLLARITKGQALDVARFGEVAQPRALATAVELHEYTYLVAGCVGEFWTRLCFRHVRHFAEWPEDEMIELGTRYGVGLQLINILRDAHADLQAGRCYFPMEELHEIGISEPSQILREPDRLEFVLEKWREEAKRGLNSGINYVHAIRHRRIRGATALPALIGARTLALLHAAGPTALLHKVKVPRSEVRKILALTAVTFARRETLEKMFRRSFD
jgi:farnesyl-diphosphate farnesyltransferase